MKYGNPRRCSMVVFEATIIRKGSKAILLVQKSLKPLFTLWPSQKKHWKLLKNTIIIIIFSSLSFTPTEMITRTLKPIDYICAFTIYKGSNWIHFICTDFYKWFSLKFFVTMIAVSTLEHPLYSSDQPYCPFHSRQITSHNFILDRGSLSVAHNWRFLKNSHKLGSLWIIPQFLLVKHWISSDTVLLSIAKYGHAELFFLLLFFFLLFFGVGHPVVIVILFKAWSTTLFCFIFPLFKMICHIPSEVIKVWVLITYPS